MPLTHGSFHSLTLRSYIDSSFLVGLALVGTPRHGDERRPYIFSPGVLTLDVNWLTLAATVPTESRVPSPVRGFHLIAAAFNSSANTTRIAPDTAQQTRKPIVSTRSHFVNSHELVGNSFR